MNSVACVSKVLERIVENMKSFEEGESITHLLSSVSKIGSYALEKSLPCFLLRNVFLILRHFKSFSVNSSAASTFLFEAHCFFKTKNLCPSFKLVFLSCFPPAVETEALHLLNMCLEIKDMSELSSMKTAVTNSCLPSACVENPMMLHKVNCIFKKCFNTTKGNPVVGYLISAFNKSVANHLKPTDSICWFSEDLSHLDILFSLQYEPLLNQQTIMYLKQIILTTVELAEHNMSKENDLMFLTVVFPSLFHQLLVLHREETFDAFKFLRIVYNLNNIGRWDLRLKIENLLKNPFWKYLLES